MPIFFNSWEDILRVIIAGLIAYPGLIFLLRVFGKRSLSKLNIFDFIITVALGSVFASVVTLRSVTIFDGLVTFVLLLGAQLAITRASIAWEWIDALIKAQPTLVFFRGVFLEDDMRTARVTHDEILAEVRQKGIACLDDVYAVVLETNGFLSVIHHKDHITNPTLADLHNFDAEATTSKSLRS